MVLDTSAVLAVLQDEPEREALIAAIDAAPRRLMSVASYVEAAIVLEARFGPDAVRDLDLFVAKAAIELVPVDAEQGMVARDAYRRFGKGRHPAGLNFGDCFSYALAWTLDEALLYKGTDFAACDIDRHAW
jgi:ribonuclease VapC